MTLDASGTPGAAAPAPPRDGSDRAPETRDEGLRVLEALLADPSAVSSEETGFPPGPMPESSNRDDVFGEGNTSDWPRPSRLPLEEPSAVPVSGTHSSALQPAPGSIPEADAGDCAGTATAADSLTAHSDGPHASNQDLLAELEDETTRWDAKTETVDASSVPVERATPFAGSAAFDDSAGTSTVEGVASRDEGEADDLLAARADTDAEDSIEYAVSGEADFGRRGVAATPGTVDPETPADSPGMIDRDDIPGGQSGREAAVSASVIAAVLDDALIRDIGETPSVSSDSLSADLAGAAALAAGSRDAGAEAARDRGADLLSEAGSSDPDTIAAAGSPSHRAVGVTGFGEPDAANPARLEHAEGILLSGSEERGTDAVADEQLDPPRDAFSLSVPTEFGLGSSIDTRDPGEGGAAFTAEDAADVGDAEIEGDTDSLVGLAGLGAAPTSETDVRGDGTLMREIADAAADSSVEIVERRDAVASGTEEDAAAYQPVGASGPAEEVVPADGRAQEVLQRHASESEPAASGDAHTHTHEARTHEEASFIPGSLIDGSRVDEPHAAVASDGQSGSNDAPVQEGASPVICLPDLSGTSSSEAAAAIDESPVSLAEFEGEVADPESARVIALSGPGDVPDVAIRSRGTEVGCGLAELAQDAAQEDTAGTAVVDALLRDMADSSSVCSDQVDTPETAAGVPVPDGHSPLPDVDAGGLADLDPAPHAADSASPLTSGSTDEPAGSVSVPTSASEGAAVGSARSQYTDALVEAGREDLDDSAKRTLDERLDAQADLPEDASRPYGSTAPGAGSSIHWTDSGETAALASTDAAAAASTEDTVGTADAGAEEGASSVIHLPDLSGTPASGTAASPDDVLLRQIAEVVAASAAERVGSFDVDAHGSDNDASARGPADEPEDTEETPPDDAPRESASGTSLPGSEGLEDGIDPIGSRDGDESGAPDSTYGSHDTSAQADASATDHVDSLLRDMVEASAVSSDQSDTPASAAGDPVLDPGSDVDAAPPTDTGPALHLAEPTDPAATGNVREPRGVVGPANQSEGALADSAHTEDLSQPVPAELEASHGSAERPANEHLDERGDLLGEASSLPGSALREAEPSVDRTDPGEVSVAGSTGGAVGADNAGSDAEEGAGSVILLPDLSVPPAVADTDAGRDDGLLRQIADTAAASSGEPVEAPEFAFPGAGDTQAGSIASPPGVADEDAPDDSLPKDAEDFVLPDTGEAATSDRAIEDESRGEPRDWPDDLTDEAETAASGIVFDDTLALDLADTVPISSDEAVAPEPGFDISLPDARTGASHSSGEEPDPAYSEISLEAESPGPAAALAFATDPDTEMALRDGLLGFGSGSAGTDEAQVWQGGLKAAIAALAEGRSAPLVIVDIDGLPYPAGAIHELAAVCEVGTVVIAVGSDDSARPGRELLLAGVSDYLAKPLTAEAVRGVAGRALADAAGSRSGGLVASFAGCGGSGATTMATAAALQAAARGCYVSVLDLSRSVPAAALALGVDPAAGLDQLLETAAREAVEPEALEGVCARRSDRIEVYAHRWSPEHPAAASAEAVDSLLAVLRLRSQMVVVDGLDESWMRFLPAAEIDTRVFVAEPTAGKTPQVARMVNLLNSERPLVFVQNHTRAFRRNGGGRALWDAGIGIEPDVVVPFDPALPQAADWGWPQGKLPRSLRKPATALTDRLLGASSGAGAAPLAPARAA